MKRIARILSVLCIVCLLCAVAQADTMSRISVQDAFLGEGSELKVIVHSTLDEARNPEECFAELDEQRVAIKGVQPYAETGEGTSWVFLTDTATVSTDGGAEPIKASLGGLIANMKDGDNAVLVSTGMSFEGLELISDKNALNEQIEKMASSANQTLYATISEAVTFLTTQSDVRPHACIVILSSGKTDSEEGMTLAELQEAIADANVTVYTVAFTTEDSDALTDYFTLARNGCGGTSIKVPIKPEVEEVITPIVENENRFYMMTTAPLTTTGEKLKVYVSCNISM